MAISNQDIQFSASVISDLSLLQVHIKAMHVLDEVIKECNYDSNLVIARYEAQYRNLFKQIRTKVENGITELQNEPEINKKKIEYLQNLLEHNSSEDAIQYALSDMSVVIKKRIDETKPSSFPSMKFW